MTRTMLVFGGLLTMLVVLGLVVGVPSASRGKRGPMATTATVTPTIDDGVGDPGAVRSADSSPEMPSVGQPRSSAALARLFAEQQANWSYRTIARQYARLAALSTGSLRRQLQQASQDALRDETLRRDRVGSRGRVLGLDIQGTGSRRRIVAATTESVFSEGVVELQGDHARVYLGQAQKVRTGWAMTAWKPQP